MQAVSVSSSTNVRFNYRKDFYYNELELKQMAWNGVMSKHRYVYHIPYRALMICLLCDLQETVDQRHRGCQAEVRGGRDDGDRGGRRLLEPLQQAGRDAEPGRQTQSCK